jgi:GDP-L-fucose synthase
MNKDDVVYITSDGGMIGSAIWRRLFRDGFTGLVTGTTAELDLTDRSAVDDFFREAKPDYVFLNSARVGGIQANRRYPAEFIYENIQSQTNVIHAAWRHGVKKLLYLGSSCIYPKKSPQPMKEDYLMTGLVEPTSEPYAVAKIAGITMCRAYNAQYGTEFIPVIPGDVYGPGDDFNPETGHVLPSLLARMHRAKLHGEPSVVVWGTGAPRRETLHVDDLADACIYLMDNYSESEMINIGAGNDISIDKMALIIKEVVGFAGDIVFDTSKPDGIPRKLLDNRRIDGLGWQPKTDFLTGIRQTYRWYLEHAGIKESVV